MQCCFEASRQGSEACSINHWSSTCSSFALLHQTACSDSSQFSLTALILLICQLFFLWAQEQTAESQAHVSVWVMSLPNDGTTENVRGSDSSEHLGANRLTTESARWQLKCITYSDSHRGIPSPTLHLSCDCVTHQQLWLDMSHHMLAGFHLATSVSTSYYCFFLMFRLSVALSWPTASLEYNKDITKTYTTPVDCCNEALYNI